MRTSWTDDERSLFLPADKPPSLSREVGVTMPRRGRPGPPDPGDEEKIRKALREMGEGIHPDPGGLDKIRKKIRERESKGSW